MCGNKNTSISTEKYIEGLVLFIDVQKDKFYTSTKLLFTIVCMIFQIVTILFLGSRGVL